MKKMKTMKKVMAVALALMLAVSAAIPAFALEINRIELKEYQNDDYTGMTEIFDYSDYEILDTNGEPTGKYLVGPKSADYYFWFSAEETELKNIRLTSTGDVTAKIVKYDHDHMFCENQVYYIALNNDKTSYPEAVELVFTEGEADKIHVTANVPNEGAVETDLKLSFAKYGENVREAFAGTEDEYDFLADVVKALNTVVGTKKFRVVDVFGEHSDVYVLVKVTTPDNYGVSYKEGKIKMTADSKAESKKKVSAEITVITDTNIFDPDEVEWAADTGYNLNTHDANGFSDYLYTGRNDDYLDNDEVITVVTTNAFNEIKGQDLGVETYGFGKGPDKENLDMDVEVLIKDVSSKQKGVNFAFKGPNAINKKGVAYDEEELTANQKKDWETYALEFGFPCTQVLQSDAEITFAFDELTNLDLLDMLNLDLEEEDTFVFHVLKDGKDIGEYKVNYGDKTSYNEPVEFKVEIDKGSTLGMYRIQFESACENAEDGEDGETNPDTGAPVTFINVASAAAVISAVAGAAVIIGKKHK